MNTGEGTANAEMSNGLEELEPLDTLNTFNTLDSLCIPDRLDILKILGSERGQEDVFESAAVVRSRSVGACVHLRGLIEFSNHCRRDCLYCGLRRSNTALLRYRMTPEEIVDAAVEGAGLGLGTIVLQSGEDPWYTGEVVADIVASIKERTAVAERTDDAEQTDDAKWTGAAEQTRVAVALSLGERERHEYALWRQAGADRYLLKHETSDEVLYRTMKPGCRLRDRLQRLEWLGELGYEVGSGIIIGLPGQALETIAGDIAFLGDFGAHMASAGPFIPHAGTPLGNCQAGDAGLTLRVTAVMRLELPWANIPATSALGTLDSTAQAAALACGANVLMPNITPAEYRRMYEIYPAKVGALETPAESVARCRRIVESAGLAIGAGPGGCAGRVWGSKAPRGPDPGS